MPPVATRQRPTADGRRQLLVPSGDHVMPPGRHLGRRRMGAIELAPVRAVPIGRGVGRDRGFARYAVLRVGRDGGEILICHVRHEVGSRASAKGPNASVHEFAPLLRCWTMIAFRPAADASANIRTSMSLEHPRDLSRDLYVCPRLEECANFFRGGRPWESAAAGSGLWRGGGGRPWRPWRGRAAVRAAGGRSAAVAVAAVAAVTSVPAVPGGGLGGRRCGRVAARSVAARSRSPAWGGGS
jgi:hypothetical protein